MTRGWKRSIIFGSAVDGQNDLSTARKRKEVEAVLDENRKTPHNSASLLLTDETLQQQRKAKKVKTKCLTKIAKQHIIPLLCCCKQNDLQVTKSKAKANEF